MVKVVEWYQSFFRRSDKITLALIQLVVQKLMLLLQANIPIIQCVELLERSEQSVLLKKLLYYCKKDLCAGNKISDSFLCFSDYVEPIFYHLFRIGEETGNLEWAMRELAHYLEIRVQFQKNMQRALFYPLVILIISLLLFLALLIFIVPEFAALFEESKFALPLYTQVVFALANHLKRQLPYVLLGLVLAIIIVVRLRLLSSLPQLLTGLLTKYHLINSYRQKCYLADYCQQLATCLAAGLSLIDALSFLTTQGRYVEYQMISELLKRVKAGAAFSAAMEEHHYFPIFMIEMIRIGETSGTLQDVLLYLANYYRDETEAFLLKVKTMIEPLIICMLGALIGCLVLSIYLPIFKLGSVLQ